MLQIVEASHFATKYIKTDSRYLSPSKREHSAFAPLSRHCVLNISRHCDNLQISVKFCVTTLYI